MLYDTDITGIIAMIHMLYDTDIDPTNHVIKTLRELEQQSTEYSKNKKGRLRSLYN